ESRGPAPDGGALFARRSSVAEPPVPVRIDLAADAPWQAAGRPVALPSPTGALQVPGRVEDVSAQADDGVPIRGWLVLPDGASEASPAPLLLWVHGGPVMGWDAGSGRGGTGVVGGAGGGGERPGPAASRRARAESIRR